MCIVSIFDGLRGFTDIVVSADRCGLYKFGGGKKLRVLKYMSQTLRDCFHPQEMIFVLFVVSFFFFYVLVFLSCYPNFLTKGGHIMPL